MNMSFCSLVVLFAATFYIASAGKLVEECEEVWKILGEHVKEARDVTPECAHPYIEGRGYFDADWDFETVKRVVGDAIKDMKKMKEEGKEEEWMACQLQIEEAMKDRRTKAFQAIEEGIDDGCKNKFQEIMNEIM